jgi:Domain of unknown function (DUF1877)
MGMILYLRKATDSDLAKIKADASQFSDFFFDAVAQEAGDCIEFDKAWHALDFTLTNGPDSESLELLMSNGEEIGEDLGYGPGRVINNAQVAAFHSALSNVSDEELRVRYDPAAMVTAAIYLSDSLIEEGEGGWEYVAQGIPGLRKFVEKCAIDGSSVIIGIS